MTALVTAPAFAQPALTCPALPTSAGLHWEQQTHDAFVVCKGIGEDGRAVLNIMLSPRDPDLVLVRSFRAEPGSYAGEDLHWYKIDNGNARQGEELRRITVVKVDKRQYAQIWINANDANELTRMQALTATLGTDATLTAGRR